MLNIRIVRRSIVGLAVAAGLVCLAVLILIQPPAPRGSFPPEMPDAEKRQIVEAANDYALSHTFELIRARAFGSAWESFANAQKQKVHRVVNLGEDMILVSIEVPDSAAPEKMTVSAQYAMNRRDDRWRIVMSFR